MGPVGKLLILYACLYVWFLVSLFFSQKNYPTHTLGKSVSSIVFSRKNSSTVPIDAVLPGSSIVIRGVDALLCRAAAAHTAVGLQLGSIQNPRCVCADLSLPYLLFFPVPCELRYTELISVICTHVCWFLVYVRSSDSRCPLLFAFVFLPSAIHVYRVYLCLHLMQTKKKIDPIDHWIEPWTFFFFSERTQPYQKT
jgi:hypothetical protein